MLDRLEKIRLAEGLNKRQFETAIGKSSGYLKILSDKGGTPGGDVFVRLTENFRKYDLNWLMTGDGNMLKEASEEKILKESPVPYAVAGEETTLLAVRNEIKKDLHELAEGLTKNFEVVSDGIFETLKGQQKILRFIEELDAERISKATGRLEEYMNSKDQ